MGIKHTISDHRNVKATFPSATAVNAYDLLYNNAGAVARASAQADQLTEALNQAMFARLFMGVSADQRLSTETGTGDRVVIADGIFDVTCPSTTWAWGDLIGASENSGGDGLENQQVERVTDPTLAIGYCVLPTSSAVTTVRCRLISKYLPDCVVRNVSYASYYFTGTPAATDQAFFVAPHACRVVSVAEVHSVAAGGTSTLQVVKDSTTAAPGAGTDLLSAAFDLNGTANTVQQGALSATAADLVLAAGDRISVDFANAIQSSAGVVVTVGIVPL